MLSIRTILHPTDFSEPSEAALRMACSLARGQGSRLVVLHVISSPSVACAEGLMMAPCQETKERLWSKLDAVCPTDPEIAVEQDMAEGDPATEILRVAKEIECDLIVMGCHGRTGLARLLMGSVAEEVVRGSTCPVLTVKCPVADTMEKKEANALVGAE